MRNLEKNNNSKELKNYKIKIKKTRKNWKIRNPKVEKSNIHDWKVVIKIEEIEKSKIAKLNIEK